MEKTVARRVSAVQALVCGNENLMDTRGAERRFVSARLSSCGGCGLSPLAVLNRPERNFPCPMAMPRSGPSPRALRPPLDLPFSVLRYARLVSLLLPRTSRPVAALKNRGDAHALYLTGHCHDHSTFTMNYRSRRETRRRDTDSEDSRSRDKTPLCAPKCNTNRST